MLGYLHSCSPSISLFSQSIHLRTTASFSDFRHRPLSNTMFGQTTFSGVSLDAAGLVALADLSAIAKRTAIIGSASALDILFLAPGIHKHQNATEVNFGEQPATAALTTGYIFRVENPATVCFMQRIGVTGHLVNIEVKREKTKGIQSRYFLKAGVLSSILFLMGPLMTIAAICFLGAVHDWWGIGTILALIIARLLNVVVIRRRSKLGWKGRLLFCCSLSQTLYISPNPIGSAHREI